MKSSDDSLVGQRKGICRIGWKRETASVSWVPRPISPRPLKEYREMLSRRFYYEIYRLDNKQYGAIFCSFWFTSFLAIFYIYSSFSFIKRVMISFLWIINLYIFGSKNNNKKIVNGWPSISLKQSRPKTELTLLLAEEIFLFRILVLSHVTSDFNNAILKFSGSSACSIKVTKLYCRKTVQECWIHNGRFAIKLRSLVAEGSSEPLVTSHLLNWLADHWFSYNVARVWFRKFLSTTL